MHWSFEHKYNHWPAPSGLKSCSNRLVNLCFDVEPQSKHFGVREWQDLSADNAPNALLTVSPPPTVGQTSPETGRFRSSGRPSVRQHESQAPPLWWITINRVYLRNDVGQVGLCIGNTLPSKVRELLDLVGEHEIDCLFLEYLRFCRWRSTVIEKCRDDFCLALVPSFRQGEQCSLRA